MMNLVVKMEFGSAVYGTSLPTSDRDFKGIFLPTAKQILLQKAPKCFSSNTKKDSSKKNEATDIDEEFFSLHSFIKLALDGQVPILDMLFTPKKHILFPSSNTDYAVHDYAFVWEELQHNKYKFLHSNLAPYIGYILHQTAKYSIKGSRLAAMRAVLNYLVDLPELSKIHSHFSSELPLTLQNEYSGIVLVKGPKGIPEPHIEVCGRKVPFHATVKYAKEVYQRIFDLYGERAKLSESNEGVDWKAVGHALRICGQARELLTTGHITFPRPNADLLLKVRKGEIPYKQVSEWIESGADEIKTIKSILPNEPDYAYAERFVEDAYRDVVLNGK